MEQILSAVRNAQGAISEILHQEARGLSINQAALVAHHTRRSLNALDDAFKALRQADRFGYLGESAEAAEAREQ